MIDILTITESVEEANVPRLRRRFWDLAIEGKFRIVVNLSGATSLDFKALDLIALTARVCRCNDGDLVLSGLSEPARLLTGLSGLGDRIRIFETDEDAARYFGFGNGGDGAPNLPPRPTLKAHARPE